MNCYPNDDEVTLQRIEAIIRHYKLETWARRIAAFAITGTVALFIGYLVAAFLRGDLNP